MVLGGLTLGVGNLAVVDDDGVATSAALLVGPADALGELGLGVRQEELEAISIIGLKDNQEKEGILQCHRW